MVFTLKLFAAVGLSLLGLFLIFFGFGWATLVGPQLEGWAWWSEVLRNYLHDQGLMGATILGLILVVAGVSLCINLARVPKRD